MLGHHRLTISLVSLGMTLLPLSCGGTVSSGGGGQGSTSSNGSSGTGGQSGTSSSGSTTSSSSGGSNCGDCMGFTCCGAACVNTQNDIKNCGACGAPPCTGPNPYCDHGTCGTQPCDPNIACPGTTTCCGSSCCNLGDLCCSVPGPVGEQLGCHAPTPGGTCPTGCLQCKCTSPDTPIATPSGDRPIAELAPGDLVYSVRGQGIEAVPILRVNKVPAHDHHVVRVDLDSGAALEISPKHPTADGRTFADLKPGDRLDGARVVAVRVIPYTHPFTHDILPDSNTGTYFAAGALIGSTLYGLTQAPYRLAP